MKIACSRLGGCHFFFLLISLYAIGGQTVAHDHSLACGADPSIGNNDHESIDEFMGLWSERRRRDLQLSLSFTIPVCFHIIRPVNDTNTTFLDAEHLQIQLDVLNRGFSDVSCCDLDQPWCTADMCSSGTGFTFAMAQVDPNTGQWNPDAGTNPSTTDGSPCITRSFNDEWYTSSYGSVPVKLMQYELRQGDSTVLNVYYTDILDIFGTPRVVGGLAQFPYEYAVKPKLDGVFVSIYAVTPRNVTEEALANVNTLIHETGHWLGLFHTFDIISGCSEDPDGADDTPIQKVASFGCDTLRDTCPNQAGLDPVHNFMDYSNDKCTYSFTPDQRQVMEAFMLLVRLQQAVAERPLIDLTVDPLRGATEDAGLSQVFQTAPPVDLNSFDVQYYRLMVNQTSRISCEGGNGFNLLMRKRARPDVSFDLYDCTTALSASRESCNIYHADDEVYALVQASGRGIDGFVLRCAVSAWDSIVPLTLGIPQQMSLQPEESALYRLEDLPKGAVISCALEPVGRARMTIEFDHREGIFEQVAISGQCNSDGSRCTQELIPEQTAMNVVVSAPSSVAVNLTLTCSTSPKLPDIQIEDGVLSMATNLTQYGLQLYELDVGRNGTEVQCVASSASGEGHLFLQWGNRPKVSEPVSDSFECRTESLMIPCNATYYGVAGIYYPVTKLYVGVEATTAVQDLAVLCSKVEKTIEPIENATMVGPLSLQERKDEVFELRVAGGMSVTCVSDASNSSQGEVDMYFRLDEPLDLTAKTRSNCSAETSLSQESCSLNIPDDSESSLLYITLLPYDGDVEDVTLFCIMNNFESPEANSVVDPTTTAAPIPIETAVPVSITTSAPIPIEMDPIASTTSVPTPMIRDSVSLSPNGRAQAGEVDERSGERNTSGAAKSAIYCCITRVVFAFAFAF